MTKSIRDILNIAALEGFHLHRSSGKHLVFRGPGRSTVVTSKTACDHRTAKNFVCQMRRAVAASAG